MCNIKTFLFIYNGIASKNYNSSYNIKKFGLEQFVVTKFNIYAIDFKFKSKSNSTFNYNFRFFNLYLVDKDLQLTSISTKQKQNSDE